MLQKSISLCTFLYLSAHGPLVAMEQTPLQEIDLALIDAAKSNNHIKVNEKLQLGASINLTAAHTTALIEACSLENDNEKLVKLLLESKAEPNLPNKDPVTPIHFAVQRHNAHVLTLLQKAGAEVNTQDNDGNTPLHKASLAQVLDSISWLAQAGANLNVINKAGLTPLHIAVLERRICSYALLLHYGARLDVVSETSSIPNQALTLSPGSTVFHASTQIEVFDTCMQKAFISHALFHVGNKSLVNMLRNLGSVCPPEIFRLSITALMPSLYEALPLEMFIVALRSPDNNMADLGKDILRQRSELLRDILRKTDSNNQTALMKETQKNGNVQSPNTLLDPVSYEHHLIPFVAALRTNTLHMLPNTNVFKVAYEDALPRKEEARPVVQTQGGGSCVVC